MKDAPAFWRKPPMPFRLRLRRRLARLPEWRRHPYGRGEVVAAAMLDEMERRPWAGYR